VTGNRLTGRLAVLLSQVILLLAILIALTNLLHLDVDAWLWLWLGTMLLFGGMVAAARNRSVLAALAA